MYFVSHDILNDSNEEVLYPFVFVFVFGFLSTVIVENDPISYRSDPKMTQNQGKGETRFQQGSGSCDNSLEQGCSGTRRFPVVFSHSVVVGTVVTIPHAHTVIYLQFLPFCSFFKIGEKCVRLTFLDSGYLKIQQT
jgi:hypothetical protein